MIRVSVHLISARTGATVELARMDMCNDGDSDNERVGHYIGQTYKGRDTQTLNKRIVSKAAHVKGWRRQDFHIWNLVAKMLREMGYTKGQ